MADNKRVSYKEKFCKGLNATSVNRTTLLRWKKLETEGMCRLNK